MLSYPPFKNLQLSQQPRRLIVLALTQKALPIMLRYVRIGVTHITCHVLARCFLVNLDCTMVVNPKPHYHSLMTTMSTAIHYKSITLRMCCPREATEAHKIKNCDMNKEGSRCDITDRVYLLLMLAAVSVALVERVVSSHI